jgi:hypothetical protein
LYPSHTALLRSHKLNQFSSQCAYSVLENVPAAVVELRDLGASKIQQLVYFSGVCFLGDYRHYALVVFLGPAEHLKGFSNRYSPALIARSLYLTELLCLPFLRANIKGHTRRVYFLSVIVDSRATSSYKTLTLLLGLLISGSI